MELIRELLEGNPSVWGGGVAHSVLVLALVVALGVLLSKVKIAGISLGVTWILFVGIFFSHFGMSLNEHLLHFMKEFGLILFVYSIGLQVGPGFFSAFKKGGLTLNLVAMTVVALGVITTCVIHWVTGLPMTTMVGILSGAVTNTPGLGAAQQAFSDMRGVDSPDIALGYAVAYPLGVVGIITTLITLKYLFRVDTKKEEQSAEEKLHSSHDLSVQPLTIRVRNEALDGKMIREVREAVNRHFVISRIVHADGKTELVNAKTVLHIDDILLVVCSPKDSEAIITFLGKVDTYDWEHLATELITRRITITKPELHGKSISQLQLRNNFGVSFTRINRAGVDLVAAPNLLLQLGDRVTIVGPKISVGSVEKVLGNSLKRLNHPNLLPIFIGVALGVLLGSISFNIPGVPQPVKLGLAGGPLIVSILISRFGPQYKLITYTTMSANLMLREIGISLFLACVGLGAGSNFVKTIIYEGGYVWIGYGVIITILPLLLAGLVGRYLFRLNYFTLIGVLAGSTTDPPALAYANEQTSSDAPSVGYATVYPFTMFLRVLTAQLLILLFC